MNKEMKSKEAVKRTRSGWLLRAFMPAFVVLSLIALSLTLPSVADTNAQPASPESLTMSGCPNVSNCLREIQQKISKLRAYVRFVKPGDPVEFREVSSTSSLKARQAAETFKSLRAQFASVSESSPWGQPEGLEAEINSWKKDLSAAQGKLDSLGQATDRNAASAALNYLSASVQRLQSDFDNGRQSARRFRKKTGRGSNTNSCGFCW